MQHAQIRGCKEGRRTWGPATRSARAKRGPWSAISPIQALGEGPEVVMRNVLVCNVGNDISTTCMVVMNDFHAMRLAAMYMSRANRAPFIVHHLTSQYSILKQPGTLGPLNHPAFFLLRSCFRLFLHRSASSSAARKCQIPSKFSSDSTWGSSSASHVPTTKRSLSLCFPIFITLDSDSPGSISRKI